MKKTTGILCCIAMLSTSCQRIYYAPNQPFVPDLRKERDFSLRGGVGAGHIVDLISEFQGAYSPWNHVGLTSQAAFYYGRDRQSLGTAYLAELGLGGYCSLSSWVQASVYGGYGGGHIVYRHADGFRRISTHFDRLYLLPCLSYGNRRSHFFAGLRLTSLRYRHVNLSGEDVQTGSRYEPSWFNQGRPYSIMEPTVGFRSGSEAIGFYLQYTHITRQPEHLQVTVTFAAGVSINPNLFGSETRKPDTRDALKW